MSFFTKSEVKQLRELEIKEPNFNEALSQYEKKGVKEVPMFTLFMENYNNLKHAYQDASDQATKADIMNQVANLVTFMTENMKHQLASEN